MLRRMIRRYLFGHRLNTISVAVFLVCGSLYLGLATWPVFEDSLQVFLKTITAIASLAGALFPIIMAGILPQEPPES